jgi:D-aminoacyl-tRNA deacylase
VQRVESARVHVGTEVVGAIGAGLLVYLGFARGDNSDDRAWVLSKMVGLRIFEDSAPSPAQFPAKKKMTRSVLDTGGAVLLVSQFTLYGDLRRGLRPSFDEAMPPDEALAAYDAAVRETRATGVPVETGRFRAEMLVHSINSGPVTILIDSATRRPARIG